MSKAREIAEERYAKGELSKDELEQIISTLTGASESGSRKPLVYPERSKKPNKFLWQGVAASIVVVGVVFYLASDVEIPVTDFIAPEMVDIPAGRFKMGSDIDDSEQPVHEVNVSAFELARNELTWAEWQACEEAAGCRTIERPPFFKLIDASEQGNHPVVNVTIGHVNAYLAWISGRTGSSYRLPSEAEWDYAARAGSTAEYYWEPDIVGNRANCRGCGSQWDGELTAPVGSFDANPFGLNNMYGNVREWVADCWHDNYDDAPIDGSSWVDNCSNSYGGGHVMRGGSWAGSPERIRSAVRDWSNTRNSHDFVGLRLARTLP